MDELYQALTPSISFLRTHLIKKNQEEGTLTMTQYGNYSKQYNRQQQELRSPLLGGLTTAGLTAGTGIALHAGGKALLNKGESGVVMSFKDNMLGKGFRGNAVDLFNRGTERNVLRQAGNLGTGVKTLGGNLLGHTGDFGKAALQTPSGRWITAGAVALGTLAAWNASSHNNKLVSNLKQENAGLQMLRESSNQECRTDVF
jgi:hypothetical protein